MSNGRVACVGSFETCVELSEGKLMVAIQNEEDISTNKTLAPNDLTQESPTTLDELSSTSTPPSDLHEEHKEMTQTGAVKRDTFLKYMRAMPYGLSASFFMILLCIVTQGTVLVTIAFMSHWSRLPAEQQYSAAIMGYMVGLVLLICFWATIRVRLLFFFTIGASQNIHDRMTNSVLRAQTKFFDKNNVWRIANRFSADIGSNDDLLPTTLAECFVFAFIVIGAITATVVTLPMTLAICPPLIYSFLRVRKIFVNCSRELKRIEGTHYWPLE
jgi:ATP-binding cassette subfamily C (CFTR/MRP) protein 4